MAGNDLGSLLGGLLGGGGSGGQGGGGQGGGAGNILGALLGALGGGGGAQAAGGGNNPLGGLMEMLTKSGLADHAKSWVGTGDNQAVSGAQIAQALPDDALQKAAAQAGVSPEEAADQIARALPTAVDKLSPGGRLPTGSLEDIIKQQNL
ncbi:YidB family protein [Streptomyces sp. G-G2]|uniref:YidB family protein n=1 Tax=Streptomyces sp. G-G2 TaxID=3046201 RepID=UPI0024BB0944|nr:YidB family protein [Streptomyces sp. G-G2]MDJ0385758.1 YidB family protein [Streptomyces sp. G-G2]